MFRKHPFRLWMPFTLLCLSGCAGVSGDFECNETTTDRCMTMEQANQKARQQAEATQGKPGADALPRLAEPDVSPRASVTVPLRRSAEKLATLWIAPWVDTDEVLHQPGRVAFVTQSPHWQLPVEHKQ